MNKFVNLSQYFNQKEIDTLKKLGYLIENKNYSEMEYSTIRNNLVIDYYKDKKHRYIRPRKKLKDTGVTEEEYSNILKKMDDIEWKYNE